MCECPNCDYTGTAVGIGQHWRHSPTHRPAITDRQHEMIVGGLMGDLALDRTGSTPNIQTEMTSPNYLAYLDDEFGVLGSGVSARNTAEQQAARNRRNGYSDNAKAEDYEDVYRWTTKVHPELDKYSSWYDSGKKVWPADIELTPVVLKHWYCQDGYHADRKTSSSINLAMYNEREHTDKVDEYFAEAGLPTPSNYSTSEHSCSASFTVEDSKELWEYMGEPLPDFEYKWPSE